MGRWHDKVMGTLSEAAEHGRAGIGKLLEAEGKKVWALKQGFGNAFFSPLLQSISYTMSFHINGRTLII